MSINAPNVQRLIALIGNANIPDHLADNEAAAHEIRRIWKHEGPTSEASVSSAQYLSVYAYRRGVSAHFRKAYMIKMLAINDIIGGHGIESAETENTGEYLDHINTGDCYNPTVIYWRGRLSLCDGGLGGFLETWTGAKFR